MRSSIAVALLLTLATVAHAAQGQGGSRGTGKPWQRKVSGVMTVDMMGDKVQIPTMVVMQRHGKALYTKSIARMPDGRVVRTPVSKGTIVRAESQNGVAMWGVKYGGDSYRAQAQRELNGLLAGHGVDLAFELGQVEGIATHVFHPTGEIESSSLGILGIRGLRGGLAQQLAPHLEQLAPGGRLQLESSGVFTPVRARR